MEEQEIQKNYFAVIPANVRYDKELPQGAKLLYGEITALCNEKGYCWASNKYFSELYNVGNRTISRWISCLTSKGYLQIKIIKKPNGEVDKRILSIAPPKIFDQPTENNHHSEKICHSEPNRHSELVSESKTNVVTLPNNEWEKLANKWCSYKSQKGSKVSGQSKKEFIKLLYEKSHENVSVAQKMVEKSIASNWNNVFELTNEEKRAILRKDFDEKQKQDFENRQNSQIEETQRQIEMKKAICDKSSAIAYLKEYFPTKQLLEKSKLFMQLHEDFNVEIGDVVND